jgi:hypothetical protein
MPPGPRLIGSVRFDKKNSVAFIAKTRFTAVDSKTGQSRSNDSFEMADALMYILSQKNPAQAVISSGTTRYPDHKRDGVLIQIGKRSISIENLEGVEYGHQLRLVEMLGQ